MPVHPWAVASCMASDHFCACRRRLQHKSDRRYTRQSPTQDSPERLRCNRRLERRFVCRNQTRVGLREKNLSHACPRLRKKCATQVPTQRSGQAPTCTGNSSPERMVRRYKKPPRIPLQSSLQVESRRSKKLLGPLHGTHGL